MNYIKLYFYSTESNVQSSDDELSVGEGGETEGVDLVVGNNISTEKTMDDSDAEEPQQPNKKIKKIQRRLRHRILDHLC